MEIIRIYNTVTKGDSKIPREKITHITVEGYVLRFYTTDNQCYTTSGTLKYFSKILPESFCRLRRNLIVNMDQVFSYSIVRRFVIITGGVMFKFSAGGRKSLLDYKKKYL